MKMVSLKEVENVCNSLYIHIPFCKKICSYCDFCKFIYNEEWINKYLDSLEYEIESKYKNEELKTIYIGGGTPSSLEFKSLEKLLKIIDKLNKNDEYEYTIEFNIEDISKETGMSIKTLYNLIYRIKKKLKSVEND